ncbi:peptidoglycan D,D-transpeptidase FtsI family protein [Thiocystis violacea]|uniref:peptidoglycan D,D-transpeptidase FtsI family protein n=1 Tax=Thiocystis violacea TaxID=13725 RepID=UPI0019055240|nr:penicillin-binding transpeptidase domain-containing protein [Thiocystis violacea]MBK1721498.1 peptidoglycan glycosyltransferase [Thiocystis violacea]
MTLPLDPSLWSAVRLVLHVAFFLAIFFLLKELVALREFAQLRHLPKPKGAFRIPFILLCLLFGGLLIYQATWQLTGVYRPEFISFMQLHDRRTFNPAHWIQRGRILDRKGVVLAYTREEQGRAERVYPDGPLFAPVVGYSQPRFGATGMEAVASAHLNGGEPTSLNDWRELGRQIVARDKRPKGKDLVLTLDADLQRLAAERLGGHRGAVVLLSPRDGAVRVLASLPSYDPNTVDSGLFLNPNASAPLLNRATQGLYPPGSTFKIAVASLAIERGFEGTLDCPANGFTTRAGYRRIRDHEYYTAREHGEVWRGYGRIDLSKAFAKSSNVFFAQLGVLEGHDAFYAMADKMLLNRSIVLHESPYGNFSLRTGELPPLPDSDNYGLAQLSIGQGRLLVTPAYMAMLAASVANRGVAMRPRLTEASPSEPLGRFMSTATADQLAAMMRRVVTEGTARSINDPRLTIAGKTGTAQNAHGDPHSWFVGFAPADRPMLAVAVLVEQGGYGSAVAAPIAHDLLIRAQEIGLIH